MNGRPVASRVRGAGLLGAVLLLVGCGRAWAQISLDGDFDSGRLDSVSVSGNEYTVAPTTSLHFRITGALGERPEFRVYQGSGYVFRDDHRMVFRNGGSSVWSLFDSGSVSGDHYLFGLSEPFDHDVVYVAYWYPCSYSELVSYLHEVSGRPFVRAFGIRGVSTEGRNVYGLQVTDPAVPDGLKQRVVVVGRQHPYESLGSHIIRGMIDYLTLSDQPEAVSLRRKAILYFYPMANPDGVYDGLGTSNTVGQDPNRFWLAGTPSSGTPSGCVETDVLRQAIWDDTGGSIAFGFDLHSHGGHSGPYYWWGPQSHPDPARNAAAAALVAAIHLHDSADHGGEAIVEGTIAADTWAWPGPYADYWLCDTTAGVGFTLEPGSVPPRPLSRILGVGASICKGLDTILTERGFVFADGFESGDLTAWSSTGAGPGSRR